MIVHVLDGTYELFRHYYGLQRAKQHKHPFSAVAGLLRTVVQMIEEGATHLGVATDHVIESFRNSLWAEYKTGEGIEPALFSQFHPLEQALESMGIAIWPMVEFEADDALASASHIASLEARVEVVKIWTPDKDLAQCVVGNRVVQVDRRSGQVRNADVIRAKYGVDPVHIPDYLALVGDTADGYPGVRGIGTKTAARLVNQYGSIEQFPSEILGENREMALLFKKLATLRTDLPLFTDVEQLRWTGPRPSFATWVESLGDPALPGRLQKLTEFGYGQRR
jgi:5'-3' exonuclease